jgi:hypothetical protein
VFIPDPHRSQVPVAASNRYKRLKRERHWNAKQVPGHAGRAYFTRISSFGGDCDKLVACKYYKQLIDAIFDGRMKDFTGKC